MTEPEHWVHGSTTFVAFPDLTGNVDICSTETGDVLATIPAHELVAFAGGARQRQAPTLIHAQAAIQALVDTLAAANSLLRAVEIDPMSRIAAAREIIMNVLRRKVGTVHGS